MLAAGLGRSRRLRCIQTQEYRYGFLQEGRDHDIWGGGPPPQAPYPNRATTEGQATLWMAQWDGRHEGMSPSEVGGSTTLRPGNPKAERHTGGLSPVNISQIRTLSPIHGVRKQIPQPQHVRAILQPSGEGSGRAPLSASIWMGPGIGEGPAQCLGEFAKLGQSPDLQKSLPDADWVGWGFGRAQAPLGSWEGLLGLRGQQGTEAVSAYRKERSGSWQGSLPAGWGRGLGF